jgi:dephospho-CoA kinase
MIRWAVTGPTASGKSLLTALLAERGAAVVDGDRLGHEVLARPEVASAIGQEFGSEYVAGGVVDRGRLGRLVFADPESLDQLNRLTHGPLSDLATERLDALEKRGEHGLAVFEAAVYFLLPSPPRMDLVVVVNAQPAIRQMRLAEKPGIDDLAAAERVAAQAAMEPLWSRGDLIFDNDGDEASLALFAEQLWSRLT